MATEMIIAIVILTSIVFVSVDSKILKWASNPYLIPPMTPESPTQYLVFHGPLSLNYTLSRLRCEALGGDLADIDTISAFQMLHARLHSPAFIASFLGSTYKHTGGIAMYPGGAIAVPEGGGQQRLASICEVPFLGKYAIDLSRYGVKAEKGAQVGVYGEDETGGGGGAIDKGMIKGMDVKSQTVPVTTVTIYGSIETDPALPCCRCC